MKKNNRLIIVLIIIFTILIIIPISTKAGNTIHVYAPYPQGNIGISRPEIGWKILLEGNEVASAEFLLNNEPLKVYYSKERETFYAIPGLLLSGMNNVKAKIKIKNWDNIIEKSWTFTVNKGSLSYLPNPNQKQLTAINLANDYRYILDIPLFRFNRALNMSAQKHADYQANLNVFSHYENASDQGFFGETVSDRANYYGFYGDVAEDISYQSDSSIHAAIDSLFDAPYHRLPFLIPSLDYLGYGRDGYYHVIDFGSQMDASYQFVAYPVANQVNIPIAWEDYEKPDPLRFYKTTSNKFGYPIVAGVYGNNVTTVRVISAKLLDSNQNVIPIYINSPKDSGGNDSELSQEVILIPKYPLKLSSKYQVELSLDVKINSVYKTITKSWYFTTEEKEGMGVQALHHYTQYPPYSQNAKTIQFKLGQRFTWVDSKVYPLDVVPYITNGRTMVPFRALGNALGAYVSWNPTTKTIVYKTDNMFIELPINSNSVIVNGQSTTIDQGATIESGGRSYVPIRFISEKLGAKVNWISAEQKVSISNQ